MKNKLLIVLVQAMVLAMSLMVNVASASEKPQELEWTDLMPDGYNPDKLLTEYQQKYKIDELPDSDPTIIKLMSKLEEILAESPLNTALNGKLIKLPG